ncbi:MAG: xanthine dehydrogenase family protein [Chloroflexi bacterium]|nr:xanthine dehydrogenase family protein [Chloroflexota bacterium]
MTNHPVPQSPSIIGQRVPKMDAMDKATGRIEYGHDVRLPGMLVGKILYANVPHARIVSIDTSRAKKIAGVKAVLTAQDTPRIKFGFGKDNLPLKDKVLSRRDEVAAVAAVDEDAAYEALALIRVEYEPLLPVFDAFDALEPGAPRVHESRPSNLFDQYDYAHGDGARGLDTADVVVEDEFEIGWATYAALEPTTCMAQWDTQGRLTIWSPTQIPFLLQRDLSEALGISGRDVRVLQPAIGGSFGRGLDVYPIEPICALLAKAAQRPVRIIFSRDEEFLAVATRQPVKARVRSGAKRDGTLWARDFHLTLDAGPYISWGALEPLVMMEAVASLYRVPHARFVADVVYTNNLVSGAVRGYGNPQGTFFVESSMEHLARELGMDSVEFRLKNANRPNEETPQGLKITSCGLRECLMEAAERIGWGNPTSNFQLPTSKLRRGIGIAATLNVGGGARIYKSDGCGATVKVDDFGRVTLVTGSTEIGQGSETALAQITAEALGVRVEDVSVVNNDTNIKPWDVGTHASRTTFIAGKAVWIAAKKVQAQILEKAGEMLGAPVESLEMRDRMIRAKNDAAKAIAYDRVVRAMHYREGGVVLSADGWYDPPTQIVNKETWKGNISAAYGFGAQAAEVEVDLETGKVRVLKIVAAHDVGKAINPMAVEGQIEGGVTMGLGFALSEALQVQDGRILNPTLLDYRVPTALDVPKIETVIVETHDPEGPFGAKGVGEQPVNPTAAAIANAVFDAIGVRVTSLPLTGEKILRALKEQNPKTE